MEDFDRGVEPIVADGEGSAPATETETGKATRLHRLAQMRRDPEAMFFYTDTADAPWTVIKSSDKKRARLACMQHFLHQLSYPEKNTRLVRRPDPLIVGHSQHVIGASRHVFGPSLGEW